MAGSEEAHEAENGVGESRFIGLHWKPDLLARHGLPDIAYPMPADQLDAVLDHGSVPLELALVWLQQAASEPEAPWLDYEPAMARLAELLASRDTSAIASVAGDNWWLELGPVDLAGPVVTIQRQDRLIAAIARREDGRLRVAVYRPLDDRSAGALMALSMNPHPVHGVAMRENNWEYALDQSAGFGQWYAAMSGRSCLSLWEKGLGLVNDGTVDEAWHAMRTLTPRPLAHVATELGVNYQLGDRDHLLR